MITSLTTCIVLNIPNSIRQLRSNDKSILKFASSGKWNRLVKMSCRKQLCTSKIIQNIFIRFSKDVKTDTVTRGKTIAIKAKVSRNTNLESRSTNDESILKGTTSHKYLCYLRLFYRKFLASDRFPLWQNVQSPTDPGKICNSQTPFSQTPSHAGKWGNYLCDSPWRLINSSVYAMKSIEPNPDFIIWTG